MRAVDLDVLRRIVRDKLSDADTYWIAAIVGTLINGYGQLLVPWFRGSDDPFATMAAEYRARPALMLFSIALAYAFPLIVGVLSSVLTRYRNRRVESIADFPDRKPDPVFRASRNGEIVEIGATTVDLFRRHAIVSAEMVLGTEVWSQIAGSDTAGGGDVVYFAPEAEHYVVSYAPTRGDHVNVYMTRLPHPPG